MAIDAATGAVYVDKNQCDPNNTLCMRQCRTYCRRGGYPKIREQNECATDESPLAFKCNLCYNRPEGPACVATCPAGALTYGDRDTVLANAKLKYSNIVGDGHVYWASKKPFTAPASDPFIEDHISPMLGKVSNGTTGKILAIPTVLFGGLYALYRRRLDVGTESEKA
jgi:Fe-S-cluster-containing dehydrogenase component